MKITLFTLPLLALSCSSAWAEISSSHLERVLEKGALNVCTSGDYKPYSFLASDGNYQGIDIALAHSLADSLGIKINWVKTSWKTLMEDMTAGKCDIAMGGISVTLARQQKAWYSSPLDQDGKIPLVRCKDKNKYQTIEQINLPNVRLLEPNGGTNEAFAHAYLPKANLRLSNDNQAIFAELVDNKADVMITDASQARYQQKHYPQLCAVNAQKPLQYGEKAYLLPANDLTWKMYVDQWLHLSKASGEYQKVVSQWLADSK